MQPRAHLPVRRLRRPCVAAALLLLAACSEPSGLAAGGGRKVGEVVPVNAVAAIQRDVPVQVRAIGTVEPYTTISIKPQVDGQLAEVHFQEGQRIRRGDLLFTIDPRPFEAALRQAEANVAREKADANNADTELKRRTGLLKQGFVSQDEYDQAFARATALRAAVKGDEAAVENARLQLQYCSIRSPVDGRVGQILVHAGNVVKRNDTTLAVVNQIRPVYVSFSVPEQDLPEIRRRAASGDLTVEVTIAGDSSSPVRGQLRFINNTVDTSTGTVLLKGLFDNETEILWPGQFVDVELTLSLQHNVVVVPPEAVQTGQEGPYVFVVKADRTVEPRPVVVERTAAAGAVISEGLSPGDVVVTDGQLRLANGTHVEIKGETGSAQARSDPAQPRMP
jgi:multidrug efflux system membrane fusion protein